MATELKLQIGNFEEKINAAYDKLIEEKIITRLWKKDFTIWRDDPDEISNRLGWLDSPESTKAAINEINGFVEEIRNEKFTHALLLGMGGSSLAPEVIRLTFGVKEGYLDLHVLDSTDPQAVLNYTQKLNPGKTLFIVSTKSGGTVETISFMKYFYTYTKNILGDNVGDHFAAITDPGSGLESMARELNFRKIFLNDPNIGGRYSALSFFGMVPAALVGVDLNLLLEKSFEASEESKKESIENTGAVLGVVMSEFAKHGVDKLTLVTSDKISNFGAWAEQLIAESSGKDGKGILPVDLEELLIPEYYSRDRIFIYMHMKDDNSKNEKISSLVNAGFPVVELVLDDVYDLGAEFFKWEIATAIACWSLDVQPFDQPNVEQAKVVARKMVAEYQDKGKLPELTPELVYEGMKFFGKVEVTTANDAMIDFLNSFDKGENEIFGRSYVSIQAYVTPSEKVWNALHELRTSIQKRYKLAVTVGYSPRFLHSTGQLHKGDAGNGLFIQLVGKGGEDVAIPDSAGSVDSSISFGILINAQAMGDRQALIDNNRKLLRIDLGNNIESNILKMAKYF
ncbi:MAG: hypothetical protein K9J16_15565 [Melioribacteraceae bacterium]|nr:hypothetical protein [Melioribacteraceae bacterium]MCF8353370.1 hypothetical protein [Melioribacteraceae bacterium]MCF8393051.1 hypothetical protein [Melioribacteraceae bacterium]MCF8419096.1 hypothetical protein [Melioribacteraceae bacterium]